MQTANKGFVLEMEPSKVTICLMHLELYGCQGEK